MSVLDADLGALSASVAAQLGARPWSAHAQTLIKCLTERVDPAASCVALLQGLVDEARGQSTAPVAASTAAPAAALTLSDIVGTESPIATMPALTLSNPRLKCDLQLYSRVFVLSPPTGSGTQAPIGVRYEHIARLLALPRNNGEYTLAIGLKQPARVGKTEYEHLLVTFKKAERCPFQLLVNEALESRISAQSAARLRQMPAEDMGISLSAKALVAMSGVSVETTDPVWFKGQSKANSAALVCHVKASEGALYPLRSGLFFMTKPVLFLSLQSLQKVQFTGGHAQARYFDFEVEADSKNWGFCMIDKAEMPGMQAYTQLVAKQLTKEHEARQRESEPAPVAADGTETSTATAVVSEPAAAPVSSTATRHSARERRQAAQVVSMADVGGADADSSEEDSEFEASDSDDCSEEYDSDIEQRSDCSDSESGSEEEGEADGENGTDDDDSADSEASETQDSGDEQSNKKRPASPPTELPAKKMKTEESSSVKSETVQDLPAPVAQSEPAVSTPAAPAKVETAASSSAPAQSIKPKGIMGMFFKSTKPESAS